MAVAKFSWLKLASFIGALLLSVVAILSAAFGIQSLNDGETAHGVVSIAAAVASIVATWLVYLNYQNNDR